MLRWIPLLLTMACGSTVSLYAIEEEGDDAGECSDGADNDGDGDFDCQDEDCFGSTDCCVDDDNDGICASEDICEGGDDALDADGDGKPNACDPCPGDALDDSDADGICDGQDVCPGYSDQTDRDSDGIPDGCDPCPDDEGDDSDGDGICDRFDVCAGADDALDADLDGVPDACDACPADDPDDSDGDGVCDSDELCPGEDDLQDMDGDSVPDACDPCPFDATDDSDSDGVCDIDDACPGSDDNQDLDGDAIPDACDADEDGDGWDDIEDCAPRDPTVHPLAGDTYGDGADTDCDGVDCSAAFEGANYLVTCPGLFDRSGADARCQTQGYDGLASIHSAAEQALFESQGDPTWNRWIGGTDAATPYSWKWASGVHFRYANWAAGGPATSTEPADGDCLIQQGSTGLWVPSDCTDPLLAEAYSCEVRCVGDTDTDVDDRCDTADSCWGENQAGDLDQDGICDDLDVLDSMLLLAMPMEGGAADVSSRANTPIPTGDLDYVPGPYGHALQFRSTASHISSGMTDASVGWTVAAWVYQQSGTPVGNPSVFAYKSPNFRVYFAGGNLHGSGVTGQTLATAPPLLGWNHIALVYDAADMHLYVDGVEVDVSSPFVPFTDPADLIVGDPGGETLDGSVDDFRFYLRPLTPLEVAALAGGAP